MPDVLPRRKRQEPRTKESGAPLWIPCLFLIILLGLTVWVGNWFIAFNDLQRCLSAGHHDCGPPIEPDK